MLGQLVGGLIGGHHDSKKVKGTVVMMKKNALDFTDLAGSLTDKIFEALGQKVSFQLISSVQSDPGKFITSHALYILHYFICYTDRIKIITKDGFNINFICVV